MTTDDAPSERERSSAPDARRSTGDHGDAAAFEGAVLGGVEGGEDLCKYASARAHAHAKRGQGGGSCDEGTLGPTVLGSRCSESTSV